MTRRETMLIVTITALGAALRVFQIGAQSLWFDELLSVTISRLDLFDVLTISGAIDPPLYYFLLHFWLGMGWGDGFVRFLSALVSVATIPAIFILGKRLVSHAVGLVSALIFSLAPLQLFYAQEARMYALLVFFSTLTIWSYHRAQASHRTRDWGMWVVLTALAIYSHIFAGVLLVALDLDAVWRWRAEKALLREVTLANLAIGLMLVPWMALLLPKFGYLVGILWLAPPTILHPFLTLDSFVFGYTLSFPISVAALFILVATLLFLLTSLWRAMRRSTLESSGLRLLLLAAFFPIIFTLVISQFRSMYLDRWLLGSSPAFYVLLAWGVVASDHRSILRLLAILSTPLILIAIVNYFTVTDFNKPPLREAIANVAARRAPNELVIHTSDSSFLAGRYYDPAGNHVLLFHPADQWLMPALMNDLNTPFGTDAMQMISDQKTYWVVVALDHIVDEQMAEKAWFDHSSALIEENSIGKIGIYHYRQ